MSDKLEALSQPVAWTDAEELAEMNAGTYADMFNGKHIPTDDGRWLPLYSQEYVTALLAALEEKDQSIAELESVGADKSAVNAVEWMKRANAAEQREGHLKASVDVLSAKNAELQQRLQQYGALPTKPTPVMLYAIWAHRNDMRGQSENKMAEVSYHRLRQVLSGTAQPQCEWERPSKYGFKVEGE